MKRLFYSTLLATLLTSAPCVAQYATPRPIYVGILSQPFSSVAAAQQQDEWCWAASAQMILNWYHIPVTQQMIVQRVKKVLIDQGGSDEDISESLNGWAPGLNGSVQVVSSVTAAGLPAPRILLQELSSLHPILLTFATGADSGHAVVITAASFIPSQAGPLIMSLVIRDPWPSPSNISNQGRVEIAEQTLANLLSTVRSHWLVSVSSGSVMLQTSSPASSGEPTPLDNGDSTGVADLCAGLATYAKAAVRNFSSLRGEQTGKDSDTTTYRAKVGITGFRDCEINLYSDPIDQPSSICRTDSGDIDELFAKIQSCLPEWTSKKKYKLDGPDGVRVWLSEGQHGLKLWVDAPLPE